MLPIVQYLFPNGVGVFVSGIGNVLPIDSTLGQLAGGLNSLLPGLFTHLS